MSKAGGLPFEKNALKVGPVVAFRQNNRARGKRSSLLVSECQCRKKVLKDVTAKVTAVFEILPKVSRRIINLFYEKTGKKILKKAKTEKRIFLPQFLKIAPPSPPPSIVVLITTFLSML